MPQRCWPRSFSRSRPTCEAGSPSSGELIADDAARSPYPRDRQAIHETIFGRHVAPAAASAAVSRERRRAGRRRRASTFIVWPGFGASGALVGHSSAERRIRLFWIPWIERLELTDEPYAIPPRFRLERFLRKLAAATIAQETRGPASVQCPSRPADPMTCPSDLASDSAAGPTERSIVPRRRRRSTDFVHWVLGFGDQVEGDRAEELGSPSEIGRNESQRYQIRSAA